MSVLYAEMNVCYCEMDIEDKEMNVCFREMKYYRKEMLVSGYEMGCLLEGIVVYRIGT